MVLLHTLTPHIGAPSTFQRFFLSFQAQKEGFMFGCRPFIGVDGCHLKGKFPGVLLSAIAIDANNGVFPVAICICEGESKDSWSWFIDNLYRHIGMEDNRRMTFMSDKQKGVLLAIEKHWPRSSNRFSNKSTKQGFMEEISKLKTVNEDAYNYIMKVELHHWALHAFDRHVKSDYVTNNITESFNVWVDKFRGLPALSMMEGIRRKMMKMMVKRLQDARSWSAVIPPLVQKKLSDRQDEARFVTVLCASDKEFEVKEDVKFYIVNLETQSCDCGLWELSGLPCKHAMAVITTTRKNPSDFVHPYLTKDAYLRTYNHVIHPIPDQEQWPHIEHNTVLPPMKKRKPGRPKKNRKRAPEEPRKMKRSVGVKCRGCGEWGHNVRTCKNNESGPPSAKKNGANINKKTPNTSLPAKTSIRKKLVEVGSSSGTTKKRRLEVQPQAAAVDYGSQNLSQSVPLYSSANNTPSFHVPAAFTWTQSASQPLSQNAPLHFSSNATQQTGSRADPGTVAGLDIDWTGLF
ncbi:hypothetical protein EZV62_023259 [Acer yangbiense]|uniref:SWIM-type domain-containing protein n=1 Tax=Acer yangbiense TaxID=1000413 RepID=A0A5C7H1S9_9ROSI|nr:hypothetical protein EZV62_023259 [Acer yangbiense]